MGLHSTAVGDHAGIAGDARFGALLVGYDLPQRLNLDVKSGVAQRKRVGLITQRSEDRNLPPLSSDALAEWLRRSPAK